jgi:hypothetical protein
MRFLFPVPRVPQSLHPWEGVGFTAKRLENLAQALAWVPCFIGNRSEGPVRKVRASFRTLDCMVLGEPLVLPSSGPSDCALLKRNPG